MLLQEGLELLAADFALGSQGEANSFDVGSGLTESCLGEVFGDFGQPERT